MAETRVSLLLRIKDRGNAAAWEEFDAIYRPMLHRFATARGLDHAAAEDVVQTCMAAVGQHIARFEYDPRKGRFKGWLRTMVNNRIRNLLRDRRERNAESGEFKAIEAREASPDELFEQVWLDEHLKHCLRQVRDEVEPSTYQAFIMYVIEERPIEEVCSAMGMTDNQVYAIKWRVTRRLRARMSELTADE